MKRQASLDLLRGLAAFSVAIPHYLALNSTSYPGAQIVAINAVEVFFVLSGFVLAPQILENVVGNPARNLRTFLVRRWMRTIPPYLIALFFISYVTGQVGTFDFARYAIYVQNLFFQANVNDYYPIAWSLSVEEWFYVTFAPILFVAARLFNRTGRRFAIVIGVLFVIAIAVIRVFWGDYDHWDAEVRRVTAFRIDSIAFGFLLFIAIETFNASAAPGRSNFPAFGWALASFVACGAIGGVAAYLASNDSGLAQRIFPYAAAAVGISAVTLFLKANYLFERSGRLTKVSFYLGRISYSVYLFHILLIMLLKPKLLEYNLIVQILIYIGCMLGLSSVFWRYFEKPILDARPLYDSVPSGERQRAVLAQ